MKIFHHCDPDGWSSASIVYNWASQLFDPKCVSINYPQTINIEDIQLNEIVYILDYSIPPENMLELLNKTPNVVWIDHHKTAIDKYENFPRQIAGIRDCADAGCELTWKYLYKEKQMPLSVKLIGDYDCWKWNYGEQTRQFFCGIKLLNNDPTSREWIDLLISDDYAKSLLENGAVIDKYLKMDNRISCNKTYEIQFEGHKCIVLNTNNKGSLTFEKIDDGKYEILVVWQYCEDKNKEKLFTVSLYAGKNSGIDVSEICKKYGGGGHKSAAGFTTKNIDVLL